MTGSVSVVQALLLGLWVWWFKSTFHPNLFFYWSKPLTASLFVGLIMGDMKTALSAGISIQLIYIGVMGIGTSITADTLLATAFGCTLAIVLRDSLGLEGAVASGLAVAAAIGAPSTAIGNIFSSLDVVFADRMKAESDKGNIKGMRFWEIVPGQALLFVFWVPVIFILMRALGNDAFLATLTNVLTPISKHLGVMAKVLPAVGIALALRPIVTNELLPWVFIGFLLSAVVGISLFGVALIAICIAFLICMRDYRMGAAANASNLDDDDI